MRDNDLHGVIAREYYRHFAVFTSFEVEKSPKDTALTKRAAFTREAMSRLRENPGGGRLGSRRKRLVSSVAIMSVRLRARFLSLANDAELSSVYNICVRYCCENDCRITYVAIINNSLSYIYIFLE